MSEPRPVGDVLVLGGTRREPTAYVGLGILGFVVVVMSFALWHFAGQGPRPVPIVWGIGGLIALRLLATRELHITSDGILLTRHLLGWRWSRHCPANGVAAVRVRCDFAPTRHQRSDGTPEGDARLLMFTVTLRGWPRLALGFSRDVAAMEALASRVALLLGVPALRRFYLRRGDGVPIREKRGPERPIA